MIERPHDLHRGMGRHRAPSPPRRSFRLRRRHTAVIAAAMVAMAWLPAELADIPAVAPPAAAAAEEPPSNDTAVIPTTPVRPPESHAAGPEPVPGTTDMPETTQATTAPATTVANPTPEPAATTTPTSAPTSTPGTTQAGATTPPRPTPATTSPRPKAWPPNCGATT